MNILGWIAVFSSSYLIWLTVGVLLLAINIYCWKSKRLIYAPDQSNLDWNMKIKREKAEEILSKAEESTGLAYLFALMPLTIRHPVYWLTCLLLAALAISFRDEVFVGFLLAMFLATVWTVPCTLALGDLHLRSLLKAAGKV
jgi:hypothetical protein